MADRLLQGGCSCGRNQYEIVLPVTRDAHAAAEVLIDESSDFRRAHASPLPTLLRIPLPWLQSTTYAFYEDERPSDIRRVFTPHHAPQTRRNFCGFCGTSLSFWSEETQEEADFICINLDSLESPSLKLLNVLGVLSSAGDADYDEIGDVVSQGRLDQQSRAMASAAGDDGSGQPWVEESIETGPMGRLKRRRGGQTSSSGRTVVEWEVIELDETDEGAGTPSKKVLVDPTPDEDVHMRGN